MLPPHLDATGVKPAGVVSPAPAAVPVSDARQAAFQRALSGLVGQSMKGEVLSKYDDGSYLVRVAGSSARMQLPGGAQVGAEVPLTLVSVTPRPTFQVGNGAQTAQPPPAQPQPQPDSAGTSGQPTRLPSQDTPPLPGRQPGAATGTPANGQPGGAAGAAPNGQPETAPGTAAGQTGTAAGTGTGAGVGTGSAAGQAGGAGGNPAAGLPGAAAGSGGQAGAAANGQGAAGGAAAAANPATNPAANVAINATANPAASAANPATNALANPAANGQAPGAGLAGAGTGTAAAGAGAAPGTAAGANAGGQAAAGAANGATAGIANQADAANTANASNNAAAAQARSGTAAQAGGAAAAPSNPQPPASPGAAGLAGGPDAALADAAGQAAPAPQARPQSLGATLLGKAPLTPAEQLPQLSRDTPAAVLSPAARAIAGALSAAYTSPGVPATINGKAPLVSSGVPDADQLAHSLKNALGESGLFYESHVAEWAEGKRPLQELMREPQNQRAAQAQAQHGGPQTSETLARAALASPDLSAAQMINQQLHAHEQQRVQWNGQAWPGQPVQWEVQRDQREGGQHAQQEGRDGEAVWRSGVRFRLPLLGKISAAVTLVGEQVHIQVQTGNGDSAATLRAWSGQLQLAMEAAGSPLASLTIAADSAAAGGDGATAQALPAVAAVSGGGDGV